MNKSITKRQRDLITILYNFIKNTGYPPTFEEMRQGLKVSSNQSVIDLLVKLQEKEIIKRNESTARGIAILPVGYKVLGKPALVPFLGIGHAGAPIDAIQIDGQWQTISSEVAKLANQVYLIKVSGDSMINAGIDDGDLILVKEQKEFVSGDIVLAQIGNEATIKRFVSEDKAPYLYLKPENPEYEIIHFTEDVILKGKVISVLKSGYWQSTK